MSGHVDGIERAARKLHEMTLETVRRSLSSCATTRYAERIRNETWETLSEEEREAMRGMVRAIVEAYHGGRL